MNFWIPPITANTLETWYAKLNTSSGLWKSLECYSKQKFFEVILSSDLIIETPYGYVRIVVNRRNHDANFHGVLWSPRAYRELESIGKIIDFVFKTLAICRLETIVPTRLKSLNRFVKAIGFDHEGTLKAIYKIDNILYDGECYSIVRR